MNVGFKGMAAGAAIALAMLVPAPVLTQTNQKLDMTAFAVNMSNIGVGNTAVVEISITRWTTADERTRLIGTMIEKGQDTFLKELQKMPTAGRFRIPGLVGPDPH